MMKPFLKVSVAVFVHTDLFTAGEIRGQITQ